MTKLRNVAVILAGGTGTRVGLSIPKQLIKIAGKTILEHTISVFNAADDIDEIIILMTPGYLDPVHAIVRDGAYPKVTQVLEGGATRNETTSLALSALGEDECNVLFHDAVRPLVSQKIISDVVEALADYEAVDTAIPSADTIVQVHAERSGTYDTIE
ncbi:MAG: NTP transferase domain-containing protein, partial [Actinomycetales bacterium]|nr:NTP transferase domain-containing protein [Actinomycetales bacterium]